MLRRPPRSTLTVTRFPDTTLFRSLRLKHDIVRQRKAGSAIFPHWGFCRCFHDYLFIHHAAVTLYRNALSPSRQMTGVRNSPLNLKSHVGAAETASAAPKRPSAPRLQAWSLPPAGACRIRLLYPPRSDCGG